MCLLIVLLGLLEDGPSKDGAGDSDRRRCGATGKESDGDERGDFLHWVSGLNRVGKP
jgi:hypothetical protein